MTRAVQIFPIAALGLSAGLHLAGFALTPGPEEIQMAGGDLQTVAMLGDSLADLVETVTAPAEPAAADAPIRPDPIRPAPITPAPPVQAATAPVTPVAQPVTTAALPVTDAPVLQAAESPPADPAPPRAPVAAQPPTAAPVPPDQATPTLRAQTPDATTPRPKSRPKAPPKAVAKTAPPPKKKAVQAKQTTTKSARKGQTDGAATGTAARSSKTKGQSQVAGNAAASNYPGIVMRKIQRTRKERAGARGKARVAFTISGNGAVASVNIVKSSGSARVDQIALRHIRRAGPFPPPPQGARKSFSLEFVSKG